MRVVYISTRGIEIEEIDKNEVERLLKILDKNYRYIYDTKNEIIVVFDKDFNINVLDYLNKLHLPI